MCHRGTVTEPRFSSPIQALLGALVTLARTSLIILAIASFATGTVVVVGGNDLGIFLLMAALGLFTLGIGVLIATRPS